MGITGYDNYLLQQQYSHDDRPLNDDKIWCVFTDGVLIEASADEVWIKETLYNEKLYYLTIGKGDLKDKIEYGWVYANDFDPNNLEYTYRLFNPVETFKNK